MLLAEREQVEKIIEQELSSLLLRSVKAAEREGEPHVKDTLQLILRVIEDRREERKRAGGGQP